MASLAKNSITTFISNILLLAIGMVGSIIIARILGPKSQGIYSVVMLIPNMISIFLVLGADVSSVYLIGSNIKNKRKLINFFISLAIIISLISIVISVPTVFYLKDIFFKGINSEYLILVLVLAPLTIFNNIISSIFKGLEQFLLFNTISIFQKILFLISVLLLFILPKIEIILWGWILSSFIQTLYLLLKLKVLNGKFQFYLPRQLVKESLTYGIKAYLSNLITFLNYRSDVFILKIFLNATFIGYYSVAVSIVEKMWILSTSVSTVIFPRIAATKSNEERNNITGKMTRIVLFVTLIITIFLLITSDWIIPLLFSTDYVKAIAPLKILLVGIFSLSFSRVLSNDIAARGYPQYNTVISFINFSINIILNLLLIPKYQINGAAIATSVSYTVQSILTIVVYIRISQNNLMDILIIKKKDVTNLLNLNK